MKFFWATVVLAVAALVLAFIAGIACHFLAYAFGAGWFIAGGVL